MGRDTTSFHGAERLKVSHHPSQIPSQNRGMHLPAQNSGGSNVETVLPPFAITPFAHLLVVSLELLIELMTIMLSGYASAVLPEYREQFIK